MPKLPVRDLARYGVITDVKPFDLPVGAWSMAVNASFTDGHVSRAAVLRSGTTLTYASPRHCRAVEDASTGFDTVYVSYTNGKIDAIDGAVADNVSLSGYGGNDESTKVLLSMNGADAATVFTDSNAGGSAHTWTANGNAQIDTAVSKFGGASGLFDGTGDWIDTPDHADFALGSGNWTIDTWFQVNAAGGTVLHLAGQNDNAFTTTSVSFNIFRETTNVIKARVAVGSTIFTVTGTTQYTSVVNTGLHHVEFVRTGNTLRMFLDGVQEGGDVSITGTVNNSANKLAVGRTGEFATNTWNGWVDEFRISVGIARHTAGFTPNTAAYDTGTTSEALWTSTVLGGVVYFNRPDRVPWSLLPTTARFTALANWDANWRTNVLRAYNASLVALNVTKTGVSHPNMVKTSDILADNGIVPTSWDHTLTTNNATENQLVEMQSGIVDGCVLGSAMIIYGRNEAWVMQADGSSEVYAYRKLPFSKGALSVNCSIEVDNRHFVFGPDDIWMHDGLSERSIASGKVRKYVFSSLVATESERCFVTWNPVLRRVLFCYVSGDANVKWTSNGCNRAAVYDPDKDIWDGFLDLPLVFSATMANADVAVTWAASSGTWATFGGSWDDLSAGFKRAPFFVGETYSTAGLTAKLYGLDNYTGGVLGLTVNTTASPTMLLARDGLDLDEVGEELSGYKYVTSVYPEATLDEDAEPLEFRFGSSDYFTKTPTFSDWQTYGDADEHYKLDYTEAGRYLSMEIRFQDYRTVELSGLDLDMGSTGNI